MEKSNGKYKHIFLNEDIAICGIVKAELIYGAKSEAEINTIIASLNCFSYLEILKNDWDEIGKLLNNLKRKGVKVPFQDAVLSYLAIKNDLAIWTRDKHFYLIKKIIKKLNIYKVNSNKNNF